MFNILSAVAFGILAVLVFIGFIAMGANYEARFGLEKSSVVLYS